MIDHFVDDKAQELFRELRIESSLLRQAPKSKNLRLLASRVARRQPRLRLVLTDGHRRLETFGEQMNDGRVEIVDTSTKRV